MDAHVNGRKRKRSALVADFDSEDDTDFRPCKRRKKRQFSVCVSLWALLELQALRLRHATSIRQGI
jgi:hypothetical protein